MSVYAENILEHNRHPRGTCDVQPSAFSVVHKEANPTCGDHIRIGVTLENNLLTKIGWEGTGCAISQAGMSILFEELADLSVSQIQALQKDDILEMLGVPISNRRLNCALLGLKALQHALEKAQ